jgi:hypothetical protein
MIEWNDEKPVKGKQPTVAATQTSLFDPAKEHQQVQRKL